MNVLYVIPSLAGIGGAESYLAALVLELKAQGHSVAVICTSEPGERSDDLIQAGIPVHCLNCKSRVSFRAARQIASIARDMRADVIHSHLFRADLLAVLASYYVPDIRLISTEHSSASRRKRFKIFGWIFKFTSRRFFRIITVSKDVETHLVEWAGIRPSQIVTIYNGIDLSSFKPVIKQTHIRSNRIGIIGQLIPRKDVGGLLEAVKILASDFPDLTVDVVGDGPLRAELEALCDHLGLNTRVKFLGYQKDVASFLASWDLLVMNSRSEGHPITLLEAIATGCPVVATRVGGIPEMIEDGVSGRLIAPNDPQQLASAISCALHDLDNSRAMARVALGKLDQFSIQNNARELIKLYSIDQ